MYFKHYKYINRWPITISAWLILSSAAHSELFFSDQTSFSVALFTLGSEQFCIIRNTQNHSVPVCFYYKPELRAPFSNQYGPEQYLSLCPDEPARHPACYLVTFARHNTTKPYSADTEARNSKEAAGIPDPAPLYELWNELWHENIIHVIQKFIKESVDDVVEDTFAIVGTPLLLKRFTHYCPQTTALVLATVPTHYVMSQMGDYLGDRLENEKETGSNDSFIAAAVSDIVEDGVKLIYLVVIKLPVISAAIYFLYTDKDELLNKIKSASYFKLLSMGILGGVEFTREVFGFLSDYNWLNQRSDQLGDYAKDWVHYLQGHPSNLEENVVR